MRKPKQREAAMVSAMHANADSETPPPEFAQIIRDAFQADYSFFQRHPEAVARLRPIIYGEFWPTFPDLDAHIVGVVRTGQRCLIKCGTPSASSSQVQ
jgi:hypothetical protein